MKSDWHQIRLGCQVNHRFKRLWALWDLVILGKQLTFEAWVYSPPNQKIILTMDAEKVGDQKEVND